MNRKLNKIVLTRVIIKCFLEVSSVIGICPVRFNPDKKCLSVFSPSSVISIKLGHFKLKLNRYKCWLVYYAGIITTRFGFVLFIGFCLNSQKVSGIEQIICYLYVTSHLIGLFHHAFSISRISRVIGHVNHLVTFDQENSKIKNY